MNELTLYRKYRPQTFSDVVGQPHITHTLSREIITGKIGHAYLFCGTRGTGKTSIAKIFSRAVNCENLHENGDPCNECSSCRGLLNGTIMDVMEIDAASNNGVEHVRALRNEVIFAPSAVKYRVYIIDEVHMMTTSAFNALLKTLEEPPAHAIFVLATTEANKVPATIQSRCQRFDFRRISSEDIAGNLLKIANLDGFTLAEDAAAQIGTLADGAMRDALSLLEQCKSAGVDSGTIDLALVQQTLGISGAEKFFDLASAIAKNDIGAALVSADEIMSKSGDSITFVNALLSHFRDLAVCKNLAEPAKIVDKPAEIVKKFQAQAEEFSNDKIVACMQKLAEIIYASKQTGAPKVLVESGIVMMCK
ncbi:hypothetical protein FACS189425_06200 [Clostridia bacterium]|nr:hypothetical protein FACS189425_06200 [Clostridia bacterium]